MPKWTWGIGIALAGVIALTAVAIARPKREVDGPTSPSGKSSGKPMLDSCCLADELASRASHVAPSVKPVEVAAVAVRLRGRVLLPWPERKKSEYSYVIYLFTPEGKVEGVSTFNNRELFELPNVTPGRKAVLFYPTIETLTIASQVVVVPERGDSDVTLKPQLATLLAGRVVDANGAGVGGVTVSSQEALSFPQELYLQGKPATAAGVERTGAQDTSSVAVHIDPLAAKVTRSVLSDSRGHFSLPISSRNDPVPLTILRGKTELLKEETVLPANGPVRIVVPNQ